MSRRRRKRGGGSGGDGGDAPSAKSGGQAKSAGSGGSSKGSQNHAGGKKGNRPKRGGRSRRNRRRRDGAGFWGDGSKLPEARTEVRITDQPDAVVRSLGAPPLPGHEVIAEHYFAAVYDRAVTIAGALGAAGGLIQPDELSEELPD